MKTRILRPANVTDQTPNNLYNAGWRLEKNANPFLGWWQDPRTGSWYAISQAEAVRQDRATPRYCFR